MCVGNILKTNLYNLSIDELRNFFIGIGEKDFRAEQLWNWLYVKGIKKNRKH
jgi:23S rRNA (adenine2503-C2)-methyltransferase